MWDTIVMENGVTETGYEADRKNGPSGNSLNEIVIDGAGVALQPIYQPRVIRTA